MKKAICIILIIGMLLSVVYPVAGAEAVKYVNMPIVTIRGDANPIYSADSKTKLTPVEITKEQVMDIAKDIYPTLLKGLVFNNWDDYVDALSNGINSVYEPCHLDDNGEASDGSGIHKDKKKENEKAMRSNYKKKDGSYDLDSYIFWYDWRKDPFEVAAEFDEYITGVIQATGKKWVSVRARCLGGSFLLTYLATYGYSKIYNIALDSTVANGSEKFSDFVCGNIVLDFEAFEREQTDDIYYDSDADTYRFSDFDTLLNEIVVALIDMCNENGMAKISEKTFQNIFVKLKDKLIPRLVMATYGTFPGYWTTVFKDDYQTARNYIFGTQEMQEKYAGLLEKLDHYDREVRQKIPEILNEAKEHDSYVGIVVKYGYQLLPFIESCNEQSDGLVSTQISSFGATVAPIGQTLSKSYIRSRNALNLQRYISPDNIIDASTSLFPDSTWYIKGVHHNSWPDCMKDLFVKICTRYGRLTIYEEEAYPQFMVFDKETYTLKPMTTENCNTENFNTQEIAQHGLKQNFQAFRNLFKKLFELLKQLIFKKL
ncbi:MAG: hypothetical protein MJ177_00930 [Clostridia bacterium]|nr:hypothetical protein [Clostridia bacterium]